MRYNFFAPLPPLFSLLTTPEKGRNCPFSPLKSPSSPAAMRLFTSSLPPPLYPAFVPSPAFHAYTLYIGAWVELYRMVRQAIQLCEVTSM